MPSWSSEARDFLSGRSRAIKQPAGARDERGRGGARIRERGAAARPHLRAVGDPGRAERQSALDSRGGRVRDRRGGRAVLRRGVLLPHLSELGQPRLFSARRPGARRRRRCSTPFWRSSISSGLRRGSCCLSHAVPSAGTLVRSLERARRPPHRDRRAAARREEGAGRRRLRNAREALSRKLAEAASQEKLLAALGHGLRRRAPLRRVEVYDNSHIMGTNAIGAMIVAGPEGFVKNQYRTFNIKSADLTPGDDYAMMREVLTRRFARLMREGETAEAGRISRHAGPRHHRRRARAVRGGARGDGRARRRGRRARLDRQGAGPQRGPRDVLRRGRASRSSSARATRRCSSSSACATRRTASPSAPIARGARRSSSRSPLDEIPGIGPARKRALLHAFGSAKAVARAGLADLEKTPGLNAATAKIVYDFFHEGRAG